MTRVVDHGKMIMVIRRFKVTLKHDHGKHSIIVVADDVNQAVRTACMAEGAPTRAVHRVALLDQRKVG